jgi:hypothetical protein
MVKRKFIRVEPLWRQKKVTFHCGCRFVIAFRKGDKKAIELMRLERARMMNDHALFGCSMGSGLTVGEMQKKRKADAVKVRYSARLDDLTDRGFRISEELARLWDIKYPDVWNSITKYTKDRIFKFSYHPESREFLFAPRGVTHDIMIRAYGKYRFEDYVRGIMFWDKKTVYLRMHHNAELLTKTIKVFRINNFPEDIKIMHGPKAAKSLADDLKGL